MAAQLISTKARLRRTLFGPRRFAECRVADLDDEPAGFALFFHNYSTFLGRPGVYLEDLYVPERFRGRGVGIALLRDLARIAVERGCERLDWSVLDWNEPALGFYRQIGARANRFEDLGIDAVDREDHEARAGPQQALDTLLVNEQAVGDESDLDGSPAAPAAVRSAQR